MRFFLFFLTVAGLASATTFNVNTTTDTNGACSAASCSLRAAIIAANNDLTATAAQPHVINVPAGTYVLTIPGTSEFNSLTGDLNIINHMTIHGAGAASTSVAMDPSIPERAFDLPTDQTTAEGRNLTVRFEGLTIGAGGYSAIYSQGNTVNIYQCVLKSDIWTLPSISFPSHVTVDQSTLLATPSGGGNTSGINVDVLGGSNSPTGSTLVVTSSTLAGAPLGGTRGGTIAIAFQGEASILNSTITGYDWGLIGEPGSVARVSHTTFYLLNKADIFQISTLYLKNSILADSASARCNGAVLYQSLGNNLFTSPDTCALAVTDRVVDLAKIKLTPLTPNGGPTQTFRLQYGSTAIDTGVCTDTQGKVVATDQRGVTRPQDGNGNGTAICDVGAYEARTPETTVDAIAAYNNGIKHGTLVGVGTGSQITTNQATFLSYLTTADTNVHANNYPSACAVLKTAVQASDGKTAQPDLITGSGLATFNALLVAVRTGLGC